MPIFKSEQKAKAYYLYFNTNKTQKEIAALTGVNKKTMNDWVRKGEWAQLKKSTFYSPDQEAHQLYEELREINFNIAQRPFGDRYGTKEELQAKDRIITMLTKLTKATDQWRNTVHEHDIKEEERKMVNGHPVWQEGDTVRITIDGVDY